MLVADRPATSLELLPDGTLLVGTEGGGVLEMDEACTVLALGTTVDGLPSSHVRDLEVWDGMAWAATRGGLAVRGGPGRWAVPPGGRIGSAVSVKGCADGLLLLLHDGSLSWTADGESWMALEPPAPWPNMGWTLADREGDLLALSNGTGVVLWNITNGAMVPCEAPGGLDAQNVSDLELGAGLLALATDDDVPKLLDLVTMGWLATEVAPELWTAPYWQWTAVSVGDRLLAGNQLGYAAELVNSSGDSVWTPVHAAQESGIGHVTDIIPFGGGSAIATSGLGTFRFDPDAWYEVADEATSRPFIQNLSYVEFAGALLWTEGIDTEGGTYTEFLEIDASGLPYMWDRYRGPQGALGGDGRLLDSAFHEGVVYYATGDGLVTYDTYVSSKPSRWNLTHTDFLKTGHRTDWDVVHAVETCSGRLYAGGPYGLDMMERDGDASNWTMVAGFSPGEVLDLADDGGVLLVASATGLWVFNPSTGQATPPAENWVPWAPVNHVAVSGGVAFAAVGRTLYWQDNDGTRHNRTLDGVGGFEDLVGSAERAGPVWGALNGAAVAFDPADGETWFGAAAEGRACAASAKLGDAVIRDVALDDEGIAYLATDSGVHRVEPFGTSWTTLTTSEGLSANDLRTLEVDAAHGRLWAGAYGGVDVIDVATGAIEGLGMEEGLPSNLVYDILVHQGDVWVGTDVGGAARRALSGGAWTIYNKTTGLVEDDVQALAVIGTKAVFGTDSGVSVLDLTTSTISTHTMSSTGGELPSDWVWCMLSAGGRVWAGANGGLASYDPETDTWTRRMQDVPIEGGVRSLLAGPDGSVWVGTDAGLFILDTATGTSREVPSMARSAVLSLLLDSQGQVWAGTGNGVVLLDTEGLPIARFTTRDGLVHGRVTCLAELPEGTIWLGTAGGLSRLERTRWDVLPQIIRRDVDLPELHVDGSGVAISPEEPYEGDTVTLTVRVENPSALRAIGTVVLSATPDYFEGQELASAIAYTEPGGNYTVALCWTATGGQHALWVIVDPLNRVPEPDENDNAVALGIFVNSRPVLRDLAATLDHVERVAGGANGTWTVEVVYSDADGDPPVKMYASEAPAREDAALAPVSGSGDIITGQTYRGAITLMSGTRELIVTAEYAPGRSISISMSVALNLAINITGVSSGDALKGVVTVTVEVVGPWEGTSIEALNVTLGRGGPSPLLVTLPSRRDGLVLTFDPTREGLEPGVYNLTVEARDDRGMFALGVVEGVVLVPPEEEEVAHSWILLLALMLVLLVMGALAVRASSKGESK